MNFYAKLNNSQKNTNPDYYTVEYHQACQGIINDLQELFFAEGVVKIELVEKTILNNLDRYFTRTKMAKIVGVSVRTIRNKMNERI